MKPVIVSIHIPATPEAVWTEVERVEDHPHWMADAESLEFLGDQRRGVGTRIRVETRVGPFRTSDLMEFTEWEVPTTLGVSHRGLFTGRGRFTIEPDADGTRFTWTEEIRFPWFLGGPIGAAAARPILTRIWRKNLERLRERLSGR